MMETIVYGTTPEDLITSSLLVNNASGDAPGSPDPFSAKIRLYQVIVPVLISASVVAFLSNGLIILSTLWIKQKISPNLMISLSLAGTDSWACVMIIIGLLLNSYLPRVQEPIADPWNCVRVVLEIFRLGAILTSVLHLVALAVNHCFSILNPFHHRHAATPFRIKMIIVVLWVFPVLLLNIGQFFPPKSGYLKQNCFSDHLINFPFRVSLFMAIFVPFVFMTMIYCYIIQRLLWRHQEDILRAEMGNTSSNLYRAKINGLITTLIIVGTYAIGWLPSIFVFLLVCRSCMFQIEDLSNPFALTSSINILIALKLLINPFIYAKRFKEIRQAISRMRRYSEAWRKAVAVPLAVTSRAGLHSPVNRRRTAPGRFGSSVRKQVRFSFSEETPRGSRRMQMQISTDDSGRIIGFRVPKIYVYNSDSI